MNPSSLVAQLPGGFEWIIILIVLWVLLLFGPKKLPELARALGRTLGEFKRGRQQIEKEMQEAQEDLKLSR